MIGVFIVQWHQNHNFSNWGVQSDNTCKQATFFLPRSCSFGDVYRRPDIDVFGTIYVPIHHLPTSDIMWTADPQCLGLYIVIVGSLSCRSKKLLSQTGISSRGMIPEINKRRARWSGSCMFLRIARITCFLSPEATFVTITVRS